MRKIKFLRTNEIYAVEYIISEQQTDGDYTLLTSYNKCILMNNKSGRAIIFNGQLIRLKPVTIVITMRNHRGKIIELNSKLSLIVPRIICALRDAKLTDITDLVTDMKVELHCKRKSIIKYFA